MKGVKEYTEKLLSDIPELDPDIEVVKFDVQVDHVHMMVVFAPKYAAAYLVYSISNHGRQRNLRRKFLFWEESICPEEAFGFAVIVYRA